MGKRRIIEIDQEKCTGCGECITACSEGAIEIVDGKARLVGEMYCDGLGACLLNCPEGALSVVEREAEPFDEEAVRDRLALLWISGNEESASETPVSCPSTQVVEWDDQEKRAVGDVASSPGPVSRHWPIKLGLVPPDASFLSDADLVLVADCVGFTWGGLRRALSPDCALLIGCPKFEDFEAAQTRLTEILRRTDVRSLTVVHMEVPCCAGYLHMAREARAVAGAKLPVRRIVVGIRGEVGLEEEIP